MVSSSTSASLKASCASLTASRVGSSAHSRRRSRVNGKMILPKSVCLKSPQRSSAFFQIKSACEAADPVNSLILDSNHFLHRTVLESICECQPDFAQKGMDLNSWLNLRSYLRMQIAIISIKMKILNLKIKKEGITAFFLKRQ